MNRLGKTSSYSHAHATRNPRGFAQLLSGRFYAQLVKLTFAILIAAMAPGLMAQNLFLSPSSQNLFATNTQQFTALLDGQQTNNVTWSISPNTGTISSSGLYTAPAVIPTTTTVTVTATTTTTPTKTATATITLGPLTMSISPSSQNLNACQTQQYTVSINHNPNTAVTWAISPNVGFINTSGVYTAPPSITSQQTITVTATSVADPTKTISSSATIHPSTGSCVTNISVSPATQTLNAGATQQFTASSSGTTTTAVAWTVSGSGTVSSSGLYTAPSTVLTQTTATVTATSTGNSAISGSATVTLLATAAPAITFSPTSLTFNSQAVGTSSPSQTITVTNSGTAALTISAIAASGDFSQTNNCPASVAAAGTCTITVIFTPTAAGTRTGTISATDNATGSPQTVALTGTGTAVALSVTPQTVTLLALQTQQFTATVSATWTLTPAQGAGTISNAGLYAAPACITATQTVTVTATSVANTALSTSATITLQSSNAFSYQRDIVINHTQIPNTDQANFPVMISVTDPVLASTANGGHVANPNGYDMVFASDVNCQTVLSYEIESWNAATGQLIAWVNVPLLSHTTDTLIRLCYGNSTITTNQSNPAGTWNGNYLGVYHFPNGTTLSTADSTGNASSGTASGVVAAAGFIDGGAQFNGATSYISLPSAVFGTYPTNFSESFSAWFKSSATGVIIGQTNLTVPGTSPGSWVPALYLDTAGKLRATFFWHGSGNAEIVTANAYNDNNWHFAVDTYTNGVETLYVDGQNAGSQQVSENSSANNYFLGTGYTSGWPASNGGWMYYGGLLDEVQISNIARSSDWLTAEYNNQSSPATFYTIYPENAQALTLQPLTSYLYASQTLQLAPGIIGTCNVPLSWTITPAGTGAVNTSGLYTAPSSIAAQQIITITATETSNSAATASVTVTLEPPLTITVNPPAPAVTASQNQLFTATVNNTPNPAVIWAISPTGAGTISTTGLYTAPSSIATQQIVTVTATSVANPAVTASASITLTNAASFSYHRAIVIDHTKVPNTDRTNYPVLISGTYSYLASAANGGKVQSPSGYDIVFTSDCAGVSKLNHEIESYNPATGQFTAWVTLPTVSHTTDTVFYISYGNSSIVSSTQNPTAVWDTNFQAVWHLGGSTTLSAADSTVNGFNGTINGATATTGLIGGAANFNGSGQYIDIGSMGAVPAQGTASMWVNAPARTSFPNAFGTSAFGNQCGQIRIELHVDGTMIGILGNEPGDCVYNYVQPAFTSEFIPFVWHQVTMVWNNSGSTPPYSVTTYYDGVPVQTATNNPYWPQNFDDVKIGIAVDTSHGWNGQIDEVRMSNAIRSADWITTDYNNQNSPTTFYTIYAENSDSVRVTPPSISLYALQTVQLSAAVVGTCTSTQAVTWSAAVGTINSSGLYTAPSSIGAPQNVTITATSQAGSIIGTANILLLPPATVTVAPGAVTLYNGGSQQFTASVSNATNAAVTWTVNPSGVGTVSSTGVYTAPATITALQTVFVTATSETNPAVSDSAILTLAPGLGTTVSGGTFQAILDLIADALCRRPHTDPVVNAGAIQYTSQVCVSGACGATATLTGAVSNYVLEPGASLSYTWSLSQGPAPVQFAAANAASTLATFTTAGTYTFQLTVNDSFSAASGSTVVVVIPAATSGGSLSLTPATTGPIAVNNLVSLQVSFVGFFFGVYDFGNTQVTMTVTGANPVTQTVTTNANGVATFTYFGSNPGMDTVVATNGTTWMSNSVTVNWVAAAQPLTSSPVTGQFFAADGSGIFNTPFSQMPVFSQVFPAIDFNPAAGAVPGNTSGVTNLTRPLTDIVTGPGGSYLGTISAQGGYAAGAGPLYNFSAVFTGSFSVPAAGAVTFTFSDDDAFIFSVGNSATRVSGPQTNTPANSTFNNYPVMGGVNQRTAPVSNNVTVNFPAAGLYPYEVDYAKGGDSHLTLTMLSGGVPILPATVLTLTPNTVPTSAGGQIQTFVVAAANGNGTVLPNTPVTVTVTGLNAQVQQLTTDGTGHVQFAYAGTPLFTGSDQIQATTVVNGIAVPSNVVTVNWNSGVNQAPVVSAGQAVGVILPGDAVLNGVVTDDGLPNNTLIITWSALSGPGTVTFDDANQAATAAHFTAPGTYVLQLSAFDGALTTNATVTATVDAGPLWSTGWLATPSDGSTVTSPTPITLISGITLTGGTLSIYPAANFSAVTVLNANTTGAGQIGTFDPTTLANGAYFVQLQATNSSGVTQNNLAMVQVTGNNKPGRVTATITDLTVPAPGLPIQIQRTYDSLVSSVSGDFGYGWNLGINVQVNVSPTSDVTLTINGSAKTFYFTPPPNGIFTYWYTPQYTAEPGFYGSLTTTGDNCAGVLLHVGQVWQCALDNPGSSYQPTGYQYTDPYGRVYTMGATGSIQSLKDLNGNTLTVAPTGISSTNGLSVPFVRDSLGRITQITDTLGNIYTYAYDTSGNLASVACPPASVGQVPAKYTYNSTHLLTSETDQNGNLAGTTTYYSNGQIQSITDAVGNVTHFAYSTSPSTTTVTNPDAGVQTTVYDSYGMALTVTDPLGRVTTNTYGPNHNLLTSTDPLGKTTTYTYDSNGFRTSLEDPLGDVYSAVYNPAGGPTSVTDPLSQVQNVTYDSEFRISTIADSLGSVAEFTYNAAGLPLTSVDARGNTWSYVYDQYGNRTRYTDPLNRVTNSAYDTNGNLSSQTDPRGNATTYGYDALNRRVSMTDAYGKTTQYAYDGNNNRISETDANGHATKYFYDAANRQTQITYADNTTCVFTYDFRNNKLTETDQLGRVTTYIYDVAGQLSSTTVASGTADAATTSYAYDLDGRKLTQTDGRGNATHYAYDAAGRMTSMTDAAGNLAQYGYDAKGQRTSMIDAKNRTTTYAYDARGRQLSTTTPDGKTVSKNYDPMGLVLSVTDEENRTTNYGYDPASQLVSVTDTLNQITSYSYDPVGNKLTQSDANNHTTSYAWDNLNRRTSRTLPLGQTESFTYDPASNMATRVDFNGKTTTFAYDSLNRLLSRTPDPSFTGAVTESFTYTPAGQRATMTNASGTTTYTYTNRDQILTKATPEGTLSYTYDLSGDVASVISSNANGTNVAYAWDADNRLQSVTDNRTSGVTNYSYDQTNQLATMQYPNAVAHGFSYDLRDRAIGLSVSGNTGVLASYTQTFGFAGNKLSVAEATGRSVGYSYDPIYRLLGENITSDPTAANNGSLNYSLDPVGNRQSLASTLSAVSAESFSYDADDGLNSDTYDSNGNTLASGGTNYTYDFQDRLISASTGVQIVYDGDGNRVSETAGGVTTTFLVDTQTPTGYAQIAEETVGGTVGAQFTYGLIRISQNRAGSVSYYGYDAGGSVRQLANASGTVTDTYAYDAFGNTVARTGSTTNEFQYRGEQFEAALGTYYLRARYYRPKLGRFLTADRYEPGLSTGCSCSAPTTFSTPTDLARSPEILVSLAGQFLTPAAQPITPKAWHRFLYADSDPVNLIDPSGKDGFGRAILLRVVLVVALLTEAFVSEEEGDVFVLPHIELNLEEIAIEAERVLRAAISSGR